MENSSFFGRLFQKKVLFAVLGVLVLGGAMVGTLVLIRNQQSQQSQASKSTTLYFNPPVVRVAPSSQNTIKLMINPGENLVSIVDVSFTFDPSKYRITNITSSPAFPITIRDFSVNNSEAGISLNIGSDPNKAINEITEVATITVEGATKSETPLIINKDKTRVFSLSGSDSADENVLDNTQDAKVIVQDAPVCQQVCPSGVACTQAVTTCDSGQVCNPSGTCAIECWDPNGNVNDGPWYCEANTACGIVRGQCGPVPTIIPQPTTCGNGICEGSEQGLPPLCPQDCVTSCDVEQCGPNGCSSSVGRWCGPNETCDIQTGTCLQIAPSTLTTTPPPDPSVQLSLKLPGVGGSSCSATNSAQIGNSCNPVVKIKEAQVYLFNAQNQQVGKALGNVTFVKELGGNLVGVVTFPNLTPGPTQYQLKTRLDNTLFKTLPGFYTFPDKTSTVFPPTTLLVSGDVNQDNVLDLLDWNIVVACYRGECEEMYKKRSDLNLDGKVEEIDINILLRSFANRSGDSIDGGTITPSPFPTVSPTVPPPTTLSSTPTQTLQSCSTVTIAVTPLGAPTTTGSVSLTAQASGCSNPEYEFVREFPANSNNWTVIRNYAPQNTFSSSLSGLSTGIYRYGVRARQTGKTNAFDAFGTSSQFKLGGN